VQSNCDNIQYYEIEYQKKGSSDRQRVMAPHYATAKNITMGLDYESEYWLVVIAHNNQPLDSSSASVRVVTAAARKLSTCFALQCLKNYCNYFVVHYKKLYSC